nr:transglutaminase-like domain-containing protein [Pseudomarimonas arenosa]
MAPAPGIDSEHKEIVEIARGLRADDSLATIEAIEAWVAANLRASNYDATNQGALWALHQKRGDCSEFAYLAAAMARALGLPARPVDGWIVNESGVLEAAGFHTWAEVWDGKTWRILDAHSKSESVPARTYVGFRIHPADVSSLSASFTRFKFEGDLSVRMQ